jgi:hypothetical protein
MIKTVELRFGAERIERDIDLGVLATDAYYVETARQKVANERDDLGHFRGGRVTGEVLA